MHSLRMEDDYTVESLLIKAIATPYTRATAANASSSEWNIARKETGAPDTAARFRTKFTGRNQLAGK